MKKIRLLSLACCMLLVAGCQNVNENSSEDVTQNEVKQSVYTVRFMANIPNVQIELASGRSAIANNIEYEIVEVNENDKVKAPEENPVRVDYDFAGWCSDKDGKELYDFNSEVKSNITLYAKWERSSNMDFDTFEEPKLSFVEKTDDSIEDIQINGILNMPVVDGLVSLTTISLKKLQDNKDDVKELLNYKINSGRHITSAKYENNKVVVELDNDKSIEINVKNASSSYPVSNTTYENKAQKYESNTDVAPYNVVMGGSSSMENWSTSVDDMKPVTTINVGIGGTTVEQWNDSLAYRLIYPFSPREVVLYVGINNIINAGKSGKETGDALIELFDNIHSHLEDTTIFYILMNLVPDYMKHKDSIHEANNMVLEYSKDKEYMRTIDAGTLLLKENGIPNRAYFLTDGLHMSLYGYIVWGQIVKNAVIEFEKEKYNK